MDKDIKFLIFFLTIMLGFAFGIIGWYIYEIFNVLDRLIEEDKATNDNFEIICTYEGYKCARDGELIDTLK